MNSRPTNGTRARLQSTIAVELPAQHADCDAVRSRLHRHIALFHPTSEARFFRMVSTQDPTDAEHRRQGQRATTEAKKSDHQRVGQRCEHLPFHAVERHQRQKHDTDDQNAKTDRPAHSSWPEDDLRRYSSLRHGSAPGADRRFPRRPAIRPQSRRWRWRVRRASSSWPRAPAAASRCHVIRGVTMSETVTTTALRTWPRRKARRRSPARSLQSKHPAPY